MADTILTVVVPEARLAELVEGFLWLNPKTDRQLTDIEWLTKCLDRYLVLSSNHGLRRKGWDQAVVNEDALTP